MYPKTIIPLPVLAFVLLATAAPGPDAKAPVPKAPSPSIIYDNYEIHPSSMPGSHPTAVSEGPGHILPLWFNTIAPTTTYALVHRDAAKAPAPAPLSTEYVNTKYFSTSVPGSGPTVRNGQFGERITSWTTPLHPTETVIIVERDADAAAPTPAPAAENRPRPSTVYDNRETLKTSAPGASETTFQYKIGGKTMTEWLAPHAPTKTRTLRPSNFFTTKTEVIVNRDAAAAAAAEASDPTPAPDALPIPPLQPRYPLIPGPETTHLNEDFFASSVPSAKPTRDWVDGVGGDFFHGHFETQWVVVHKPTATRTEMLPDGFGEVSRWVVVERSVEATPAPTTEVRLSTSLFVG